MKQIQTIEKGANFSAANFGNLADIKDYVLQLGPEIKIPGNCLLYTSPRDRKGLRIAIYGY